MASDIYSQSAFLVRKAAYFYYVLNMSQQEIADYLNISVTTVSRLIRRAKEEKLVKYVLDDACISCINLAEHIRLRYGIKEVIVAPISDADKDLTDEAKRKLVALESARYLQRMLMPDDVLGISWGRIVNDMLLYLNPSRKTHTRFVTLHGHLSSCVSQNLLDLVEGMKKTFSGKDSYIPSEAILQDALEAVRVMKQAEVMKVFDMFDSVNISIAGIGTWYPEPHSLLAQGHLITQKDVDQLIASGVVGDIGLRFFDMNAMECKTDLPYRTIAMGLEQYKKIPYKIVVAAGDDKAVTLDRALKGGLADMLIVDESLGRCLLEIDAI